MSLKQEALNIINKLPDSVDLEGIMYRLYVLSKIKEGQNAVKNGKTVSVDELKKEIQSW